MARPEVTGKKSRPEFPSAQAFHTGKKSRPEIPDYLIEERVIGIPVAAQIVDLSEWSLYDAIKRGKGPPTVRLCGRKIGIRIKDLKAWIASRLTPADEVAS